MTTPLRHIAVDLTPILPGGSNGGAKIFVVELISRLSAMHPDCQFTLLTQAVSHGEMAVLDRSNVRRHLVLGNAPATGTRGLIKSVAAKVMPRLPGRAQRWLGRVGYQINSRLKRGGGKRSLLHEMGADLLFCPFTATTYFELGIPTVCTIYDLQYKSHPEFFTPMDVAHRDNTFAEACRKASALAAISDYSRNTAIHHGKLDPERIRTIYLRMAQRIGTTDETSDPVFSRLSLFQNQYLIYPANFWKHKNHEMLLVAFGMACARGLPPEIKLICTGSPGPRMDWLRSAAEGLGLAGRVVLPGYLPNAELAALISCCKAMIFPSLYEGFGLPVIEAMAAGVPVGCSNSTSLPEVAAGAAVLFDARVPIQIAEAMVKLSTDDALRQELIDHGSKRATAFGDTDRMAAEYWGMFEQAMASEMPEMQENTLNGIYADGWAGSQFDVRASPVAAKSVLELSFMLPDWVPCARQRIRVFSSGQVVGSVTTLKRANQVTLAVPLPPGGGRYRIELTPTFVPAVTGYGADQRELTAMVTRCVITNASRCATIELRSAKAIS